MKVDIIHIILLLLIACTLVFSNTIVEGAKSKKQKKKKKKKKKKKAAAAAEARVEASDDPDNEDYSDTTCDSLTNSIYTYSNHIKSPSEMGMGPKGTSLSKDLKGLNSYVKLLTKGGGKAAKKKNPLGGRYFKRTGSTCYNSDCEQVEVFSYINGVPTDKSLRGLVPGLVESIAGFDSSSIQSNASDKNVKSACTKMTLSIQTDECSGFETHYVKNSDLNLMPEDVFFKKVKPTGWPKMNESADCSEDTTSMSTGTSGFKNMYEHLNKPDRWIQMYYLLLGGGGLWLLHKLMYGRHTRR